MKCPKCDFENPKGSKFCLGCGEKLELKCPSCGQALSAEAKFCNECGHKLTLPSETTARDLSFEEKLDKIQRYLPKGLTEKILAQRDKIEGERKQVTVMFCDMEGFTPLTERLGPEEAYGIMDQVYEILIHKVRDYEGTVNEMTGDGIMALFGAPIALEDAPQRAIRSALAIHREMSSFSEKMRGEIRSLPLKMRIGIHTGPVVVGTLGNDLRVEFKAVGDTVNLASRMQGLAEPGTTYVSHDTFRLTQGLFLFETLGERQVKGMVKPINVYHATAPSKDKVYRPRLGLERKIYSEMVGRDKELDRLEFQVMKAINGEGSAVNIIGEAGIGKSRLVAELKNCDVMKRVTLFEGRAISIGRNLSFHPIIDLLKQWARIKEDDGEAAAFGKLETAVRRLCPEDVREVLPFVATLMGMKLSGRYAERIKGIEGASLEKLILKNVRELLIKATELGPLVIVTEDLHWADMSSIELLEPLFRLAETQRIVFVNVFRPGHKETGDRIVETIKERLPERYTEIELGPLDERRSESLINNMLNIMGLQHVVIDQIVQRSDGNPFFIEEVLRSFIDEGVVVVEDGVFEATDKIDTVVIPHTINEVLMARIDRLDVKTRNLVKVASVIGRNFFYRIVTGVAKTVEDIDSRLSYLKEIQLIRERTRMQELEYLFKHALAQEAAYDSILLGKRKELHLMVADCIEKVFTERLHEFYGMLAYHYSRGENEDKTEEYLIKAGEEALKSSASSEALHYYQEALKLYLNKYGDAANPGKVATLEKNIALALYNRGQYVEALEHFDKALAYYGEKVPKHSISVTLKFIVSFLTLLISVYLPFLKWKRSPTQKDREIINLFYRKCTALAVTDLKRFFIEAIYFTKILANFDLKKVENGIGMLATESSLFSWPGISFRLSRKILEFCKDKVDNNNVKSMLYYEFAALLHNCLTSHWEIIKKYDDNLVNLNLGNGEFFYTANYILWHGYLNTEQGCLSDAQRTVDKLSEIADVYENDYSRVLRFTLNTNLLAKYRNLHDALIESEEGINFSDKTDFKIWLFSLYSLKARIKIMMGDLKESEEFLGYAKKIRSEIDVVPLNFSYFLLSQFIMDIYRLKESIKTNNKSELAMNRKSAIKTGKKTVKNSEKVANDRTETYKLMGVYYWLTGKQKKALKWWNKSIKEGEFLGARLETSRTYMDVGKHLLEQKSKFKQLNGISAEGYLEKARTMFQEMDLQWDLDELDRVLASY